MQKRKGLFTNMSNIKKYCAIITVDQVLMPVSHQDNKSINQLGIFQTQRKKERKEERRRCVTEEQKIWRRWGPTNGSMIWDFIAVILQKKKSPWIQAPLLAPAHTFPFVFVQFDFVVGRSYDDHDLKFYHLWQKIGESACSWTTMLIIIRVSFFLCNSRLSDNAGLLACCYFTNHLVFGLPLCHKWNIGA